jgi:hypothetical protein
VKLVLPGGQTWRADGGHHEPCIAARGRGAGGQAWGQTTLHLTPMHAAKDKVLALIANVHAALSHVKAVAEQLPGANRWTSFVDYVVTKITRTLPPWQTQDRLPVGL